ncbi:MAG: hypothetical protein RPU42_11135 [Candidatus Sedimenticola sp. (ex Thyasira tokunagai)]
MANDFMAAQFKHRTEAVPVLGLADWFNCEEGETPQWTVRGITGNELARANEALLKNKKLTIFTEALVAASKSKSESVREVQEALGVSDDVHGEIAKRLEMLVMGSVNPTIDLPVAVKLAENYPIEFYMLTNKITTLTGQGQQVEEK